MSESPIYDLIGHAYARQRRADRRIASAIQIALADAQSVLSVGAGTGSYEPSDRAVVAVDPSMVMLRQRVASAPAAICGRAEALPFANDAFDAVLGVLTLHHWSDQRAGLRECTRVARDRVVLFTFDPASDGFWLTRDYFPEFIAQDRRRFPAMTALERAFGPCARMEVLAVPIPSNCVDGFLGAFWARPNAYLEPEVRASISSFTHADASAGLDRLRKNLADGEWRARYGHLLALDALDIGYRIVIAHLSARRAA